MTHRPVHPSRMSLFEVEAAWHCEGEPPLPECTYDPDLHTGPRHTIETTDEKSTREAVAREVCAACPARWLCSAHSLDVRPTYGIWAGRTPDQIAERAAELEELAAWNAEVA